MVDIIYKGSYENRCMYMYCKVHRKLHINANLYSSKELNVHVYYTKITVTSRNGYIIIIIT